MTSITTTTGTPHSAPSQGGVARSRETRESRSAPSGRAAPPDFRGATVALFEARFAGAMESLVKRHNGIPWAAPALSEVPVAPGAELYRALDQLAALEFELVVLLTGAGTRLLLEEAERHGVLGLATRALDTTATVCRGPKPVIALRQYGITVRHLVPEPHTTAELLQYLSAFPADGARALVVSAGERMPQPSQFLRGRGALVTEVQLYRWELTSDDATRLVETVEAITTGAIDAAAFTTQVQVRHLFHVAANARRVKHLAEALSRRVLVGAVGSTCAAALRERGVEPHVIPDHPKMGHLVVALARELETLGIERTRSIT